MSTLRPIVPTSETNTQTLDRLNELLATALYFHDAYKRYHWMVTGPHFQPLHGLFDEHMETLEEEIDDLGERIRILGGTPIWNPAVYAEATLLPQPDESLTDDLKVAAEAFEMEARFADELRQAAQTFDGDFATQDLVIAYLRVHEKQAWFLREFVHKVKVDTYEGHLFAQNVPAN